MKVLQTSLLSQWKTTPSAKLVLDKKKACVVKKEKKKSGMVKLASETRRVAGVSLIYISLLELFQGAGRLKNLVGGRIT